MLYSVFTSDGKVQESIRFETSMIVIKSYGGLKLVISPHVSHVYIDSYKELAIELLDTNALTSTYSCRISLLASSYSPFLIFPFPLRQGWSQQGGQRGCSAPSKLSKILYKFQLISQIYKKVLYSAPLKFKSQLRPWSRR